MLIRLRFKKKENQKKKRKPPKAFALEAFFIHPLYCKLALAGIAICVTVGYQEGRVDKNHPCLKHRRRNR